MFAFGAASAKTNSENWLKVTSWWNWSNFLDPSNWVQTRRKGPTSHSRPKLAAMAAAVAEARASDALASAVQYNSIMSCTSMWFDLICFIFRIYQLRRLGTSSTSWGHSSVCTCRSCCSWADWCSKRMWLSKSCSNRSWYARLFEIRCLTTSLLSQSIWLSNIV